MPFAVVQAESGELDRASVRRAFERLDFLTQHDADALALRLATGILLRRLERGRAEAATAALIAEGIAAIAVDEAELLALPGAKMMRRMDAWPEALTLYDSLGRPQTVPWPHVVLVAAGVVSRRKVDYEEREWVGEKGHPMPYPYRVPIEGVRCEMSLEVLLDVEPLRLRVEPRNFDYRYLGDRKRQGAEHNFALLVSDLTARSSGAILNRGAASMADGAGQVVVYESARQFEEEVTWLIWRATAGSASG